MYNNTSIDVREKKELLKAFENADTIVSKKYLADLGRAEVQNMPHELKNLDITKCMRMYKIKKVIHSPNENNLDKLTSVYHAISSLNGSLVAVLKSDGKLTEYYLGIKSDKNNASDCGEVFEKAMRGNFSGSEIESLYKEDIKEVIESVIENDMENTPNVISAVSGVAGLKLDEKAKDKFDFIQGIEKISDAMQGEKYSLVIVADYISTKQIYDIKVGYETLYSQLISFATTDLSFSANESSAISNSLSEGTSSTINESLTMTQSHSVSSTSGGSTTKGYSQTLSPSFFGISIGSLSRNTNETSTWSETINDSNSSARSKGKADTKSQQTITGETATEGSSRSLQIKFENKSVKNLLKTIDSQLERLEKSLDLGMWNCAAYCISDNIKTRNVLASNYMALIRGDNSSVETSAITSWNGGSDMNKEKSKLKNVTDYIGKFHHPQLNLGNGLPCVTPASLINSKELTIMANLPQKSVNGIEVLECAPFGRNITNNDNLSIKLGVVHHLGKDECVYDERDKNKAIPFNLDINSFASHTFITGSTGVGKSNTIYNILEELIRNNVKFMVIEPAKGEYKEAFGGRKGITVYGTNPQKTDLLRINPFKFPEDTHVLEHIDRLIEIFNVCWAMYAAMPAVLKDAIEQAYISAGWNLELSTNKNGLLYPNFADILTSLEYVINSSAYSDEMKGNYIGALATRIKSLTNGINGLIFTTNEIDSEDLFDKNVIVDLSRVGSSETKALIMGILVMRLNEYRMSVEGTNEPLKHVTVLEEAHNILKRISTEQNQESSNMLGKSVEMIANSIAEMRTYGEGFIIADQSPGLMDMSVIRNTNTKIILRLPDLSDRELVGKSANLNDNQIIELARLKQGVAAVYQNNWNEAVLCHVDKWEKKDEKWRYTPKKINTIADIKARVIRHILAKLARQESAENIDDLCNNVIKSNFASELKLNLCSFLKKDKRDTIEDVSRIISNLFPVSRNITKDKCNNAVGFDEFNNVLMTSDKNTFELLEEQYIRDIVLQCIVKENLNEDNLQKWCEYMKEGQYV